MISLSSENLIFHNGRTYYFYTQRAHKGSKTNSYFTQRCDITTLKISENVSRFRSLFMRLLAVHSIYAKT